MSALGSLGPLIDNASRADEPLARGRRRANSSSSRETALAVALTVPDGPAGLGAALAAAREPPVELRSVEVAVPAGMSAAELLATEVLAGGGSEADARALLAERDGAAVAARVAALDPERLGHARAAFTSFGTCSIDEPVADLVALGLLAAPERISR